jgi:hypothetical protein
MGIALDNGMPSSAPSEVAYPVNNLVPTSKILFGTTHCDDSFVMDQRLQESIDDSLLNEIDILDDILDYVPLSFDDGETTDDSGDANTINSFSPEEIASLLDTTIPTEIDFTSLNYLEPTPTDVDTSSSYTPVSPVSTTTSAPPLKKRGGSQQTAKEHFVAPTSVSSSYAISPTITSSAPPPSKKRRVGAAATATKEISLARQRRLEQNRRAAVESRRRKKIKVRPVLRLRFVSLCSFSNSMILKRKRSTSYLSIITGSRTSTQFRPLHQDQPFTFNAKP